MLVGHIGGGTPPDNSYQVEKSLRFRASASAYLSRTPGSAGNRKTWTWRALLKRGIVNDSYVSLFDCQIDANTWATFGMYDAGLFVDIQVSGVFTRIGLKSAGVLRDPSGHYDVVFRVDTTQAGGADRIRAYINGQLQTWVPRAPFTFAYPTQNSDLPINSTSNHRIGNRGISNDLHFDGYLSDIYFIDGQSLDPSNFGEVDAGGVWVPKEYTGTYGTNGFYLPFSDGTSLSTLTSDASGNGNNWTANNISLTAGATYDWMDDTATNNHATLNPLAPGAANITKANLASGTTAVRATFNALAISSYWEVTAGGSNVTAGVINDAGTTNTVTVTANKTFAFRLSTAGALDYRNVTDAGSWTSITTGLTGNQFPYGTTAAADWNFGQRPFNGTVPGGYAKLCAANLTNAAITTIGSFPGNLNADGPDIFVNGVPLAMTINGNDVTFGTHANRTAGGFKVISSSASYNAAGSNTYSITSTGAAFKNARAQVNP